MRPMTTACRSGVEPESPRLDRSQTPRRPVIRGSSRLRSVSLGESWLLISVVSEPGGSGRLRQFSSSRYDTAYEAVTALVRNLPTTSLNC